MKYDQLHPDKEKIVFFVSQNVDLTSANMGSKN